MSCPNNPLIVVHIKHHPAKLWAFKKYDYAEAGRSSSQSVERGRERGGGVHKWCEKKTVRESSTLRQLKSLTLK